MYYLQLDKPIQGFKVAFLKEGFEKVEDKVSTVVKSTLPMLESLGVTVEWVSIPEHFQGMLHWYYN